MARKPVIESIKEKFAAATIFKSSCYDKKGKNNCVINLQNCNDSIILKGETVREIAGNKDNKVCDCLILTTGKKNKTHLILVGIDDGKNKKPSHAREQLIAGYELAKSILQNDSNPLKGNYNVKYIFLYKEMKSHKLRDFRGKYNSINEKPIQLEKCGYTFDCTLH